MKTGKHIKRVVSQLSASYRRLGGTNQLGGATVPSRKEVVTIIKVLRSVVFPGYYAEIPSGPVNLEFTVGEQLSWVHEHLSHEICRSLCFRCRKDTNCRKLEYCWAEARRLTMDFLRALPGIRAQLMDDVDAVFRGDPAAKSHEEVILSYPGIAAITAYRLAHRLWQLGVPLIPRIMSEYIHHETGIDIHPGATIGREFCIDHGTGVVIGETTIIGDRVKLYQGVTIGALSVQKELGDVKRHPTIQDDVTIYAGATILGGKTVIGKGSVIGGNTWVTASVPRNSTIYVKNPEHVRKVRNGKLRRGRRPRR